MAITDSGPDQLPGGSDLPSLARVYDYVAGGTLNFPIDRTVGQHILSLVPAYRDFAKENRKFLHRAAAFLADSGTDQFLDVGAGMVADPGVHTIVRRINPNARVVYVDHDPIAVEHNRRVCGADERLGAFHADLRDVDGVLGHPIVRDRLDLDRPIGLIMAAVLHCLLEEDKPGRLLIDYRQALAPGSRLVASHVSPDALPVDQLAEAAATYARSGITVIARDHADFAALLGPWQPDDEGIRSLHQWRPDQNCGEASYANGVLAH
ncbi:hypothetical protein D5S17_18960 [Pseudonocardiaceae bacterium YIM PH 21723]|nr:hypothetical protein D5S17_18960 [Pseudonocardiaceae bacterium YIM PH 21723]